MERALFIQLAQQYKDTVFRVALNCLGNAADADDAVQEVLLKLLERREAAFESPEHARNWLIRVTLNYCKNVLRSPWRRRGVPLEEAADTPVFDSPGDGELYRAVMALPERYRVPLYLFYYEGFSVRETAELLHLKPTAVTTRLSRARQMLKQTLTEELQDG